MSFCVVKLNIQTIVQHALNNAPMNDSTRKKYNDCKFTMLKKKLSRPSDNTLLFLQMFARAYGGNVASVM